ncbi:putative ABC transport system permease protein [Brevibacterium sanguinis]|uniref:ABC transport system permease protein n=2 Tax=Brevibacterium TaxID=1696 RepID=A0ABX9GVW9_9MICO|nr:MULTISPECIES: ABC transporter permease [Brevibacterium]RBP67212.1 putative ABC transport system permease protein [Brevibacterium sanguinis]RBP73737.1 putative ABC transport system permease protein [Brevibacterium celere]
MSIAELSLFLLGIAVIVGGAMVVLRTAEAGLGWLPAIAVVRAVVQLGLVALLLQGALTTWWTVVAFVALMLTTASATSFRRARALRHGPRGAVIGVLVGAAVTISLVFAFGLVDGTYEKVIAVAGIVIGNSMTIATLTIRRFAANIEASTGEVEAWLSLGARPRRAVARQRQDAIREALIPNLDQTKSTGLVTLPGAFVGALFGGASPVEAAQFQIVVLAALVLAGALTSVLGTLIAADVRQLPAADRS